MLVLGRAGLEIAGPVTDTMVLSYLLESGERNHNLDQLARRLLDHTMIPITDLIGKGKGQLTMDRVDVAKVAVYAGEDADATWRIEAILAPKVREEGLWRPLRRARAAVDRRARPDGGGRHPGRPRRSSTGSRRSSPSGWPRSRREIYALAGREFNIGSGPQLRQVLFDELKLPSLQKTPGGEPSTAQEVLEELAPRHPLPRLLIQHRQLAKLKNTYLDALPALVHPEDGRVHASFNQVVTATGRLSSSDPNLQNIPVRSEDGRQIRQAFVPGHEGWSLLTADYSQIELRILAHYTGDPALTRAFAEDHDIHRVVAARIFKVDESAVDSSMRRVAKTVNFGVIYGLSPFGLAARLGITQAEAAAFIDAYFQEYAGVDAFITRTLESALATGRVETILGRRRPINGIKSTTGRDPQPRRADRRQHRDPGLRRRPDQARHARRRPPHPRRGAPGPDAPADPRRARLRGPRGRDPRPRPPGARRHDDRTRPGRPAEGRHRRRPQLARRRDHRLTRGPATPEAPSPGRPVPKK